MKQSRQSLEHIFQTQIANLSLTLQPFTMVKYEYVARYFVSYLHSDYPETCRLSQLRRDPHMLGFFRWLCELRPPIGNPTRRQRLLCLRRLLNDLADQGHHLQPGLIIREDFPTLPEYLPRPLSPDDDRRLQDELRRKDDLYSNALLLTRLAGIRIGECIHLPLDCLRQLGPEQWSLHVPLGKLHTEASGASRLGRTTAAKADFGIACCGFTWPSVEVQGLSPASSGRSLCLVSNAAFGTVRCRQTSRLHRYETYLAPPSEAHLGHGTTQLRDWAPGPHEVDGPQKYPDDPPLLKVAQPDLQREFYRARQNPTQTYRLPSLSASTAAPDLPGIRQAVAATRHLLEMYRRQFSDDKTRRRLQRLDRRLLAVAQQLENITEPEK